MQCYATAFPSPGTRGGISSRRWRRPAYHARGARHARLRPDRSARRDRQSTRCCIWSATWSGLLDALGSIRRAVDCAATTGVHRSPGTPPCCAPIACAPSVGLSVPFRPARPAVPTSAIRGVDDAIFYHALFPDARGCRGRVAKHDVRDDDQPTVKRRSPATCRRRRSGPRVGMVPGSRRLLSRRCLRRRRSAGWLTEADLDFYAAEFASAPDFAAASTGTATSTATGSCSAPFAGAQSHPPRALHRRRPRPRARFSAHRQGVANRRRGAAASAARSCCRAAAIGPSRSGRRGQRRHDRLPASIAGKIAVTVWSRGEVLARRMSDRYKPRTPAELIVKFRKRTI